MGWVETTKPRFPQEIMKNIIQFYSRWIAFGHDGG
jgi:hypothetical protein